MREHDPNCKTSKRRRSIGWHEQEFLMHALSTQLKSIREFLPEEKLHYITSRNNS